MDRLAQIIALIDDANAQDPNGEAVSRASVPAALVYGRRMSEILDDFAPEASEGLKIAVRGQHVERWRRPRSSYAEGREGYLSWRRDAAKYHAARVEALMQQAGYNRPSCDRVASLMLKKNLKTDSEAQTLEDVACLVFFRWYAGDFSQKHEAGRILAIVTKTARKMSAKGRAAAIALGLPPDVTEAIAAAE
jgi:hypothetical protein